MEGTTMMDSRAERRTCVGFGCGVLAGLGYPLLEHAGAPPFRELMLVVMMFGWAGRQMWAMNRYR
jgi:hypothetical protein